MRLFREPSPDLAGAASGFLEAAQTQYANRLHVLERLKHAQRLASSVRQYDG